MITEDYVSFETAVLLKEKGFNEPCLGLYRWSHSDNGYVVSIECPPVSNERLENDDELVKEGYVTKEDLERLHIIDISAPTLQMAMKWLREVYGLFIRITEDIVGNVFEWSIYQKNYGCKASTYVEDSYEQACEVAIKYCLEHLI